MSDLMERLTTIVGDITLPEQYRIRLDEDAKGVFVQIECERMDVITKQVGTGKGGKAYPSEFSSESELIAVIFGLYLRYVEHEARETFEWQGARIYGPHISAHALKSVARKVDVRSAQHKEDE